ncbi:MAG: nitrogenase cofactor biosynthesis protein NifB [Nitrospinae bacterium]|nr:nitrogenase cofactor biosynthesis protein NifB [Nitrospinota bacterium]
MSGCHNQPGPLSGGATDTHPCYSTQAHHMFARMHLAVAPACNIQCNYCNRKYDCANESRPGVVSERLKPEEALRKVYHVAAKVKELSVIGIAGPGDALANPRGTMKTLRLIKEHFPDLTLCLSTNGLALPEYAEELHRLGVKHITVTMNTSDPATAAKIYSWVLIDGEKCAGPAAMAEFLARQQEGLRKMAEMGALVKVNSLLIPGINDHELETLSKKIKLMGAHMHNIMPLISNPAHGTAFGLLNWPEPSPAQLEHVRSSCGDIKQMAHCRQCRADAVGKLSEDRFSAFSIKEMGEASLPGDNGALAREKWRAQAQDFVTRQRMATKADCGPERRTKSEYLIAACTKGMGLVNQHFGHAKEFYVYKVAGGEPRLLNVRKVKNNYCAGPDTCDDSPATLDDIINTIKDCQAVVCLRVGYGPHKSLVSAGITPVTDTPYIPLEQAVVEAARQMEKVAAIPGIDTARVEFTKGAFK